MKMPSLEEYFIQSYFHDLLPLARKIAKDHGGYEEKEMAEAVSRVYEKYKQYPPTHNRTAWFEKVFTEKLNEARSDNLAFKAWCREV